MENLDSTNSNATATDAAKAAVQAPPSGEATTPNPADNQAGDGVVNLGAGDQAAGDLGADAPLDLGEISLGDEPADGEQTLGDDELVSVPKFDDLEGFIKAGDVEKATARLSEIVPGIEKLARQRDTAIQTTNNIDMLMRGVSQGDPRAAMLYVDTFVEVTGWTLDEVMELYNEAKAGGAQIPRGAQRGQRPSGDKAELEALRAQVQRIESKANKTSQNFASTQWINTTGKTVVEQIAAKTGRIYTPAQIWESIPHLPKGVPHTVENVEKAIMRANPDYYLEAQKASTKVGAKLPDGVAAPVARQASKNGVPMTDAEHHQHYLALRQAGKVP